MKYKLIEPILDSSYFGEWWIPEVSNKKIQGNFKVYSNGKYLLETIGFFETKSFSDKESKSKTKEIDICGLAKETDSNIFYLFKLRYCFSSGRIFTNISFDYRKTHVSYFLKTKAHKQAELNTFNKVLIKTLNLDVWINEDSLKYESTGEGLKLHYDRPQIQEIFRSSLCTIQVGNGYNYSFPNQKGFHFRYLPSFVINYNDALPENKTRDIANKLNWLISFSCFSPSYISDFQLSNIETNKDGYLTQLVYHDKFVDSSYKEIHFHELILNLEDLLKVPDRLCMWFNVVDDNPLLIQNFMGVLRHPTDFVENKFLSLINGVLTFAEQKVFTNKMNNEKSLFELFSLYKDCWKSFYFPSKQTTKEMVGRRHILVHNSDRVDKSQFKWDEFRLHWFTAQLQFVTMAIILRELGFADDEINRRLEKLASSRRAFDKDNI